MRQEGVSDDSISSEDARDGRTGRDFVDAGKRQRFESLALQHLDAAFPATPRLIAPGAEGQVLRFFQYWVQTTVHAGVARLVMLDLYNSLDPADQAYFRASREKQYKMSLEDIQAGRDERLDAFRKSLQPMRLSLAQGPFISGEQPGYADYLAFGGFQWARVSSAYPVLTADDAVHAWFERCLDLYDGLGRREAAAHA